MTMIRLTIALGFVALTAACGKKAETPVAAETNQGAPAEAMSGDMGNMAMSPSATSAIKAAVSSPLPLATPIALERVLRVFCNSWVSTCTCLRCASSASMAATSSV